MAGGAGGGRGGGCRGRGVRSGGSGREDEERSDVEGERGRRRGSPEPAAGPLLTCRIFSSLLSAQLLYCVSLSQGRKRLPWLSAKLSQQ